MSSASHPPGDPANLAVGSRRYAVDRLAATHPGGPDYIRAFAGKNATDVFLAYHATADLSRFDSPYARLLQQAHAAGYFKPGWRQKADFALELVLWGLGLGLCSVHPAFAALLSVAVMRLHYTQHDLLHGQWTADRASARRLSVLFTLLAGYTVSWWEKREHDPHHIFCNRFPEDPDDFIGWPATILPGLPLVQLYMQWCSLRDGTARERLLCCAHLSLMAWVIPGWQGWAIYVLTYGLLWLPFQVLHHTPTVYASSDWVTGQVYNTQNSVGLPLIGWLMAGHDRQIEHHLFPRMPRHNLGRAGPLVRAWCAEQGLPYTERAAFPAWRDFAAAWLRLHVRGEERLAQELP